MGPARHTFLCRLADRAEPGGGREALCDDSEHPAVLLGARRRRAITAVTAPLMRTALSATFLLLLMLSMRELTVPLFLYTNDTRILSIAIFDQFENGGALHVAAAMSLLYCLIMFVLSYLPRRFGKGLGE